MAAAAILDFRFLAISQVVNEAIRFKFSTQIETGHTRVTVAHIATL